MKGLTSMVLVTLSLIVSASADTGGKEKERITPSTNVVNDIFNAPDKGVPLSVLDGTKCVIVIPDLKKAAFIVGGDYGRGVMTCRTGDGSTKKCPCSSVLPLFTSGPQHFFSGSGRTTENGSLLTFFPRTRQRCFRGGLFVLQPER